MPRHQLRLDASSPTIIVPITARDLTELDQSAAASAAALAGAAAEWRVDLFTPFTDGGGAHPAQAVAALERLAGLLPDTPILATFRTTAEGGSAEIAADSYVALIDALAATGLVAAVDVEYRHPEAGRAIAAAHRHGVPVVASNHDFDATPPTEEIVARLEAMETAGADVAKIAVMPHSAADVVTLLDATERRYRQARIPLITMSMGALGAVTRIGGGAFGSAATFATVGAASAPGQLPADGVRAALDLLHRGR
ncbi:type I 3-dehydroquinate dehydratase [uncultured Dietzia sp.]|uniref:type I 3-dehydroquinate dehydratase n=1 Tax=uncultured Dietzia sp. TaxID=395519 RepID=UPI0025FD5077|nr:type I 3-dehydroquinate dehydratase [uncultured Dietzia sp.]